MYQVITQDQTCIDEVKKMVLSLINVIDSTYKDYEFMVNSNITVESQQRLNEINEHLICGNVTLHIITCFDSSDTKTELVNVTQSAHFVNVIKNSMHNIYNQTNDSSVIYNMLHTDVIQIPVPVNPVSLSISAGSSDSKEDVCSDEYSSYLDTTYKLSTGLQTCIDSVLQFISLFIEIIDTVYDEQGLTVSSNVTEETQTQLQMIDNTTFCGNITLHVISCFDSYLHGPEAILNATNVIIDKINNTIVIYILNTSINYIDVIREKPST
eukprot:77_1